MCPGTKDWLVKDKSKLSCALAFLCGRRNPTSGFLKCPVELIVQGTGEMDKQQLRALPVLPEHSGSSPSTHMAVHNHL